MTVSVIVPAYNSAATIRQTLDSVLGQTRQPDEVLVVDDGSTDETGDIVASMGRPVRYLRQENGGASSARNLGILHSTGDCLLFLDADDALMPTAIQKLAGALEQDEPYGAAYCGWITTDRPDHVTMQSPLDRPSGHIWRDICTEHLCTVENVMVRRSVIAKSGLFDVNLRTFEDYDFWIRVAAHAAFVFVPEHLVEYRRWGQGMSDAGIDRRAAGRIVYKRFTTGAWPEKLSRQDRRRLWYRVIGYYKEVPTENAFKAYFDGDWATAYRSAIRGLVTNPKSAVNRGVWAVICKSYWRQRRGLTGRAGE